MDIAFRLKLAVFIFVLVVNAVLGILVYLDDKKSATNKIFAILCLASMLWLLAISVEQVGRAGFISYSIWFGRFIIFFSIPQVAMFYFLALNLPQSKDFHKGKFFSALVVTSLLIMLANLTPLVFKKLVPINSSNVTLTTGPLVLAFSALNVSFIVFSIVILLKKIRTLKGASKKQIKLVFLGTVLTLGLIFVSIGIPATFLSDTSAFSYAPLTVLIFIVCSAIAILKFRLFNLKLFVSQLLTFLLNGILLIQLVLSESFKGMLVNTALFIIGLIVTWRLIKSFNKELVLREQVVRVESLEESNLRLQELDRQKTDFLNIAAHQLRTPASIINNYVSMMQEGDYGEIPEQLQEVVANIGQSNEWLVRLADEFLNIAHLEAGQTKYHFGVANINNLIESVHRELKNKAKRKGLSLEMVKPEESIMVEMDEEKIRQAIFNFAENAVKYSEHGKILISVGASDDGVAVSVKDEGVGFETDETKGFFQKFQRGKNAYKIEVNSSTGLGLYICRKFVEGHGGKVWAKSEGVGKGAEFGFWIPLKPA